MRLTKAKEAAGLLLKPDLFFGFKGECCMKNFVKATVLFWGFFFGASSSAYAQASNWDFEATIYLFAPETNQTITTPGREFEGTLSFKDALENLDFAFMGAFGASNGRWSFLADYMYYDLSFGSATPGPVFSSLDTDLEMQILNGYVAYRVVENASAQVDLAGGFRWFSIDTTMGLTPGGPSSRAKDDWVDPVIGARARIAFSDRWSGTVFVDYGGFSSDSETWQALLTADYAINDNWLLRGGYRYISIDHELQNADFKLNQSGLIFGATYRF